ncbi:crossover junction endodeoxyribonuclease RuvC [Candidatus Dojkabacteria bacterium]|nr:crossover junction endodeoxyribonuclease RuvC [Candidatus Dojkabacteria bacterium]
MRVLGIDPGVALTGWGVIEENSGSSTGLKMLDFGVVRTDKNVPHADRLALIYKEIQSIVKKYSPEIVAVEQLFFCKNLKTAISVGEARGVVLLVIAKAHIPIKEFTPLQIKEAVCGYGKAEKQQVQKMVASLLDMKDIPRPDDAADGLAVAICCANSVKIEQKINLNSVNT